MTIPKIRVLVLGASGMLGNAVMRLFSQSDGFVVVGSTRSNTGISKLNIEALGTILTGYDLENQDQLLDLFHIAQPEVVINCVGLVKQLSQANDALHAIPINSVLPHRLARLCALTRARLIHLSTDCVFSGAKGMYVETDHADATDLYGRSKLLGEVDYPHAITLRTSIVGHELNGARSLVNWFLSQHGSTKGFTRAIFSGLPTVEVARVIRDYVIPNKSLHGVYHLSSAPITKYELLKLIAEIYEKSIEIIPDDHLVIDRSLDSSRFRSATAFAPVEWRELVLRMRNFQ